MNDLTTEANRRAEQDLRNARRRGAWALRYAAATGVFPAGTAAACARLLGGCAGALTAAPEPKPTARVYIHPARLERHGNQNVMRFPRRHRQIRGWQPQPPEAA